MTRAELEVLAELIVQQGATLECVTMCLAAVKPDHIKAIKELEKKNDESRVRIISALSRLENEVLAQ